jgi:hypothetical protein
MGWCRNQVCTLGWAPLPGSNAHGTPFSFFGVKNTLARSGTGVSQPPWRGIAMRCIKSRPAYTNEVFAADHASGTEGLPRPRD